jgi:hypothetical protein
VSLRGLRSAGGGGNGRFIAVMGLMAAGVFLVAVVGQTMAGIVFTGCER